MLKKKTITIIAVGTLFLIGVLMSCKRGYHCGGFDEFDLAAATDRIAACLELTRTQKTDLERIAKEIVDKAKAMRSEQEAGHQTLADLIRQDTVDRETVDQLIANKLEHAKELSDFAAERLIAFHGTLTPQQREKVATHIEKHSSVGCRFGWR